MPVSIEIGNKTLELRPSSVDKSTATRAILKDLSSFPETCDFLLFIGDGKTDEVVFSMLKETFYAVTCTVGRKKTDAKFYLDNVKEVEQLLQNMLSL